MDLIIKAVRLRDFRVHKDYELNLNKRTTLIVGENGAGKTSILEAIYVAMRGKSFRAVDREMMRRRGGDETQNEGGYALEIEYQNGEKVAVKYDETLDRKRFLVKDRWNARLPKAMRYPVVLFLPEDLHLVATSPTKRREYFDKMFGQLDEGYTSLLNRYARILKQRNELLKKPEAEQSEFFSWDLMLAKYGVEIWQKRERFVSEINEKFTEVYRSIAHNEDEVWIRVVNSGLDGEIMGKTMIERKYLARLEQDLSRDKLNGNTGFGVHKDNFRFEFNSREADGSASRGEVRSLVLALKFIEAKMLVDRLQKKPVVLLDDVFSELDDDRQRSLVENFQNNQIILTSVNEVVGL